MARGEYDVRTLRHAARNLADEAVSLKNLADRLGLQGKQLESIEMAARALQCGIESRHLAHEARAITTKKKREGAGDSSR